MANIFQPKLLPHSFKKVGFAGTAITILAFIALTIHLPWPEHKTLAASVLQFVFIVSLLFLIISKEKQEDELVQRLRERILAAVAIAIIVLGALDIIMQIMWGDAEGRSFPRAVMDMEILYLVLFYWSKRDLEYKN